MKKTILFDLDGTLLPMDQDYFLASYLKLISHEMAKHHYEPKELIDVILKGTEKMIRNDGNKTNEEVFWDYFVTVYGEERRIDEAKFHAFYEEKFPLLARTCGYNEFTPKLIKALKEAGYTLILATNPIFPRVATVERMRWAGLKITDFALITTYENSRRTKPNPAYFKEILTKLNLDPENVIVVGNDMTEDFAATKVGIEIFFVTENLINQQSLDLNKFNNGSLQDFADYMGLKL